MMSRAIIKIFAALSFSLLVANPAWADGVQKFVYIFDAAGTQLAPLNAADQCPDVHNASLAETCLGVRVGNNGQYDIELPSDTIATPDQLVLIAKHYKFIAAGSKPGIDQDTYIETNSKRRLEKVKLNERNKGADINPLSEASVKAVEKHFDVDLSAKRNNSQSHLTDQVPNIDCDLLNRTLSNGKDDNAPADGTTDPELVLRDSNFDSLDQQDEEVLVELATLALENPDDEAALNTITKNVTQGLVNTDTFNETTDRILAQVNQIVLSSPDEAIMMLDADRYVARVNEEIHLSTDNAINADAFFGYTWMGVESDLPYATFSSAEPGSYLICVTGETATGGSTDCVRLEIKPISYPVITAFPTLLPIGEQVALSGFYSVGAESYLWSADSGSFSATNTMETSWTAPNIKGSYTINLAINGSESTSITIEVYDILPLAIASSDQDLFYLDDGNPDATLTSSSITTDGSAVDGIEWTLIEQPAGSDAALSVPNSPVSHFTATTLGHYVVRLTATKDGVSATDDLAIDIRQRGIPTADAGSDITTFRDTLVRLSGRNSKDPDGLPLSYAWSVDGGTLSNSDAAVAGYTSTTLGDYNATLTVSNSTNSASDSVAIHVRNRLPMASDDFYNPKLGQMAESYLHAFDADSDTLTYTLLSNPGNGGVSIEPTTGQFTYIPGGPKGCKYHPDHKPYDNTLGGKDVPVLKLCADKFVARVGDTINLTVSNSINSTKHQGFEWIGAQGDDNGAQFVATEPGTFEVCITGKIGDSLQTSTACTQLTVIDGPITANDNPTTVNDGFADGFQFLVNDGMGNSNIATVRLVVGWENTPPVVEPLSLTTTEEVEVAGQLTATDADHQLLVLSVVEQGSLGILTLDDATTGTFHYTPNTNAFGVDTVKVQAYDGHAYSEPSAVTVTITGVNDVPIASNANFTTNEDVALVGMTLTAQEPDGEPLSYEIVSNGKLGSAVLNDPATGVFTYIPYFNSQGHDQFSFRVSDGKDYSNTAVVNINIVPVNDAPVAHDLPRIFTSEDTPFSAILNGEDVDLDSITYRIINAGDLGTAVITNASTGAFTYTPKPGLNGSENLTISYVVNDGTLDSNVAYVPITITPNDPPVAADLSITTDNATPANGSLSAVDPEGGSMRYEVISQGSKGAVQITNLGTGAFTYTPNGAVGNDSFTYVAHDDKSVSNTATVTVTVNQFNNPPTANPDSFVAFEGVPYTNMLSGSDSENSPLTFSVKKNGQMGSAAFTDASSGAFSYTPSYGRSGSDLFTFRVHDGDKYSNEAQVGAKIISLNEACRGPQAPGFDSDGDGYADFIEAAFQAADPNVADPNNAAVKPYNLDPANYGVDFTNDDDSDGFADYVELWLGSDPADAASVPTDSLNKAVPACVNGGRDGFPASLLAFDILTPTLNITNGNIVAKFALTAMDNASGVARVDLLLTSPSGQQLRGSVVQDPASMMYYTVFSSDKFDYYAEQGIWTVTQLTLSDANGNITVYGTSDLLDRQFPTEIQVINAHFDASAPTLLNFQIDTPTVDLSGGNLVARFTVKASDTPAGIQRIDVTLKSPSGKEFRWASHSESTPPSSLNQVLTTNSFSTFSETGIWKVSELAIIDGAGNTLKLATSAIAAAGFATDVTVINGIVDNTAPTLTDFQILTPEVYPASGDATANYTVSASDSDSGIKRIEVMLTSPSGSATMEAVMTSASMPATITSGLKSGLFASRAEPGLWTVSYVAITDGANNRASFDTAALTAAGYATEVRVLYLCACGGYNTPPVAYGDHLTTDEDTSHSGQLQAYDADGQSLTYHIVVPAAHGSLSLDANSGAFVYTPAKDYYGSDSFTFQADDGYNVSNTAAISITVNPVNDAPKSADFDIVVTANTTYQGVIDASDVENDLLTFAIVSNGSLGTASLTNANTGSFSYSPNAMALGNDSFTFTVSDGQYTVGPFTAHVAIKPDIWITHFNVGSPVVSNSDLNVPIYTTITFNKAASQLERVEMELLGPSGQVVAYHQLPSTDPISLSQVIDTSQFNLEAGTWVFRSVKARQNGDTLQLVEDDLIGAGFAATVTVVENLTPTAADMSLTTQVNVPLEGHLAGNDPDGGPLSYTIVSQPAHGSIDLTATCGCFLYTPVAHYVGADSFTYKVSDGTLESNVASATIDVVEANGVPVAYSDSITVFRNLAYGGQLKAVDPENDALSYHLVANPSKGSITINQGTGEFVYTPTAQIVGSDSFSFYVSDGLNQSNTASVEVMILHEDQVCRYSDDAPGADDDGDGWANVVEVAFGTDSHDANATPDGMSETALGISYKDDDDLDSYFDYVEVWMNADANNSASKPTDSTLGHLPPCFDANADGIKPRLLGFDIVNPSINVAGGNSTVDYALTVVDNASGVRRVRIDLLSPSGAYATTAVTFNDFPVARGIKLTSDAFSEFAEHGVWQIEAITLYDEAGNKRTIDTTELAAAGFPTDVNVINTSSDSSGPTLNNFTVLTPNVNAVSGTEVISFQVDASDDIAGIYAIDITLTTPSGVVIEAAGRYSANSPLTLNTQIDTPTLSHFAEQGSWTISSLLLTDGAGNTSQYAGSLASLGYATSVAVTNTGSDSTAPSLTGLTILTPEVFPASGDAQMSFMASATDDISGIEKIRIDLTGPNGQYLAAWGYFFDTTPLAASGQMDTAVLSTLLQDGSWTISQIEVYDAAGNSSKYDTFDLGISGYSTTVTVSY